MKLKWILLLAGTLSSLALFAQDYNAIHGSNYSGSLGVYNNPSSIVNSPFKWDLTLFGFQYQTITNAVRGRNFPLNLSPSSDYYAANGNYKRIGDLNYNIRLLNGRVSLNESSAFAFGLNFRGYTHALTGTVNYNDSVFGPRTFLFYNLPNEKLDLDVTGSLWMELYGSYARTIRDNDANRLSVGGTLKIMRGMSAVFANVNDVGVRSTVENDQTVYEVSDGTGKYGYSDNLGNLESFEAGDLFSGSKLGVAFDIGAEYLIKTQAVSSVYDEGTEHDYEWKIGVSLLDLGWNNFAYGPESRSAARFRDDINSQTLNDKFSSIENASSFNDSLATIVNTFDPLTGNFKVFNPTRFVLNVDRYLTGNYFVNAELSLNLVAGGGNSYAVKSSKLITVTPRWETRKFGIYLPMQVNRHGNFWIGGALKAGPVLLGTHNMLNAFSKTKYISGGGYIAIVIRPVNFIKGTRNQQYDCPEY